MTCRIPGLYALVVCILIPTFVLKADAQGTKVHRASGRLRPFAYQDVTLTGGPVGIQAAGAEAFDSDLSPGLGKQGSYTITTHEDGLHGYVHFDTKPTPERASYSAGIGFYSAVWALIDQPLAGFQIGLPSSAVPEPATWALLIAGFGTVGTAMRRRRPSSVVA